MPGNPGLTVDPVRINQYYMGDLENIQFQTINIQDIVDETVVPQGIDNQTNLENNRVRITNNKEWTVEQKIRIVLIDREERSRGRNFMKRIKNRWDMEFPESKRTTQNLVDNAKRFGKEGWGNNVETNEVVTVENQGGENIKNFEWTTEMKIDIVTLDNEERSKGRGFMKRVKNRWDQKYPEYQTASWQKLRDNAARFKKEPEIMNLLLVRNGSEQLDEHELNDQHVEAVQDEILVEESGRNDMGVAGQNEVLTESDRDLEEEFTNQLSDLTRSSLFLMEPREKLPKIKLDNQLRDSANRVLSIHLDGVDTIPEISDKVYAMGRAIGIKLGKLKNESQINKSDYRIKDGNRKVRKLKKEIKSLRQLVAKTSNELHRRKVHRKASQKEKSIIKELRERTKKETTSYNLRNAKEEWLDKLRFKKVKLIKEEEKQRRKHDNIKFQCDKKGFFRKLEEDDAQEGKLPEMERFVKFWGGIWEKEEKTPNTLWMEEVKEQLKSKVDEVNEFDITLEKVKNEAVKRKGWTAPGIDGIQNFWWKKLETAQSSLTRAYTKIYMDNSNIPSWWANGRTVLLPKTRMLDDEKNYRPITCLNTSYKIMTGLVAKYMREHTKRNGIWDEGQLGAVEGVLGTVDQLVVDRCIIEEVKQYHRNLAVAFYDYKKAYDKVHHDWILRVYNWIGIPQQIIKFLTKIMKLWKTRLEVSNKGEKITSRWINIACGFLQGDSYSPVGFCISEIPVCLLLQQSRGYRIGPPGKRELSRTHSLFVDDLKVYQESHVMLRNVNEMIVQASHDTGACYGVSKCAEIVFERGKMVKGEGLQVLEERMKTMNPDDNESYKFLGVEQADGIITKKVFERVKSEVKRRVKMLVRTALNDVNLAEAINIKVIPVASYPMNVCKFTNGELTELDQIVKNELRARNILGKQSSDERIYLKRENGGRGIKSMRDAYKETRLRVACYMAYSENKWIMAAWKREIGKEGNSVAEEAVNVMGEIGTNIQFEGGEIKMDGKRIEGGWQLAWKEVKKRLKNGIKNKRIENYGMKEQQSKLYKQQEKECHAWLKQNIDPKKTGAIISMLEQMVETRAWKKARGLVENGNCRLCNKYLESCEHLVAGCTNLANTEYLNRHNRALMIVAVAWAKLNGLISEDTVWYQQKWTRGTTFENDKAKLIWDFEYNLRKTTTARRPDLVLENKTNKIIWICDMACPQSINVEKKRIEKINKYRQLAFESRERRTNYKVYIVPLIIGAMGGGVKALANDVKKLFDKKEDGLVTEIVATIQKTVLMDSESILRRVMSGLIQE